MSQRTTDKTGAAVATGDGGEGSPVELDPLGNNVGTYSPYQELVQPYEPEPQYPMLQNYFVDSPMFINGQWVQATLDGMPIGWAMAMNMLENGSAIPAALAGFQGLRGFSFESVGLGLFRTTLPDIYTNNSGAVWGTPPGEGHQEGWKIFTGGTFVSSWLPQQQDKINVDPPAPGDSAQEFLNKLLRISIVVARNLKIIGFNDEQEKMIKDRLFWMLFWKPCVDAFKVAGIPTPAEIIRDRGLVLADYELLRYSNNNKKLGITEPERRRFISGEILESQATTTDEIEGRPVYTFYKPNAFRGGTYGFSEVVPHEMIHGVGVKEHYWYFLGIFRYGHDLDGYEHYEKILTNCKLPEETK